MDFADLARLGIAMLALMAFCFFAIRINDDWKQMSSGWKITRCSLAMLVLVSLIGTIEVMLAANDVPLGIRNLMIPAALTGLLVGLWKVRNDLNPMLGGWISVAEIERVLAEVAEEEDADPCGSPVCVKARTRLSLAIAHARHDV